jgi:hypothetical protein
MAMQARSDEIQVAAVIPSEADTAAMRDSGCVQLAKIKAFALFLIARARTNRPTL